MVRGTVGGAGLPELLWWGKPWELGSAALLRRSLDTCRSTEQRGRQPGRPCHLPTDSRASTGSRRPRGSAPPCTHMHPSLPQPQVPHPEDSPAEPLHVSLFLGLHPQTYLEGNMGSEAPPWPGQPQVGLGWRLGGWCEDYCGLRGGPSPRGSQRQALPWGSQGWTPVSFVCSFMGSSFTLSVRGLGLALRRTLSWSLELWPEDSEI